MSKKYSVIVGDENTIKMSGNRILRTISGLKRERKRHELEKMSNKEIQNFQYSSNITHSRKALWTSHVARKEDIVENIKLKTAKTLLDDMGVDVDNIKKDHKEVRFDGVNWIHLAKRGGLVRFSREYGSKISCATDFLHRPADFSFARNNVPLCF